MKPSFYTPTTSPMSFTTGFRFFRCYTQLSFPISAARLPRQQGCSVATLRFLSSTSCSPRLTSANSKRRESSSESSDDGGNGGLPAVVNGSDGEGRIVATELHKEATEAYMSYAMSVLLGRALPDVRDGLKPVHRRIL
ncbi:putative DNA topoisomerase (ATP-hydrolyzing) [Helianthus anomalus]